MSELPDKVLRVLSERESVDSIQLAEELEEDHQRIVGAVKSLQSLGGVIEAEQRSDTRTELTDEGNRIQSISTQLILCLSPLT